MTKGLPVSPVPPHSHGMLQMHCAVLQTSFQPGIYEQTSNSIFSFERHPNVTSVPYTFELSSLFE
jgi:hypothetical protein